MDAVRWCCARCTLGVPFLVFDVVEDGAQEIHAFLAGCTNTDADARAESFESRVVIGAVAVLTCFALQILLQTTVQSRRIAAGALRYASRRKLGHAGVTLRGLQAD